MGSPDRPALRVDDQPEAAELGDVLAENLARGPVADVVVERAPRVGDLQPPVTAANGAEQRALDAGVRAGRCADDIRRPGRRAGAAAHATVARVPGEGVEREAAPVEEDPAVLGR